MYITFPMEYKNIIVYNHSKTMSTGQQPTEFAHPKTCSLMYSMYEMKGQLKTKIERLNTPTTRPRKNARTPKEEVSKNPSRNMRSNVNCAEFKEYRKISRPKSAGTQPQADAQDELHNFAHYNTQDKEPIGRRTILRSHLSQDTEMNNIRDSS